MVGLDYVINLIDNSFSGGMKKAKENTKGLDDAVGKTNNGISKLGNSSKKGFGSIISWAKKAAIATGLVFAIGQVSAFGNEITQQAAKFEGYENAIKFASGEDGAKNIQFLDKSIKDLNLDMTSSYEGFQTLTGSLKGTSLEGKATRDIFDAVGIAATTMNLTADQSKGAFLAIGQMASKGKVQAEELRGQLGERIPGALGIASRAMGMNQVEFNKMLDSGKVYAEDFLPKFAVELKKTFEGGLPAAANSMQAAINKKNNALVSFKKSFGDAINSSLKDIINLKTTFYEVTTNLIPAFQYILAALKPIKDAFINITNAAGGTVGVSNTLSKILNTTSIAINIVSNGLGFLIENYKIVVPAIAGAIAIQKIYAIAQIASATGTSILTVATHGLNTAMRANPIGLVITGVILLAGVLKTAYQKFDTFRGIVKGTWAFLKGFGNAIKTFVVDRIKQMLSGITGIGGALMSFFKGDWKKAWEQGSEAVKNLTGIGVGNGNKLIQNMKVAGLEAATAYSKEFDKVANKNKTVTNSVKGTATSNSNTNAIVGSNNTKKQSLSGSVSGGTASKNITFKIESLVKELKIQPQTLKEGLIDVEKQVKDILIRMMRDVETQAQF